MFNDPEGVALAFAMFAFVVSILVPSTLLALATEMSNLVVALCVAIGAFTALSWALWQRGPLAATIAVAIVMAIVAFVVAFAFSKFLRS